MKKLIIIILIIIGIAAVAVPIYIRSRSIDKTEDYGKDVVQVGSIMGREKGTIVFARHGLEKGIYSVSLSNGRKQCLTKGNIETIASGGGTMVFTSPISTEDNEKNSLNCIFIGSGEPAQSFDPGGTLVGKVAISPDGSMAVYVIKNGTDNCKLYSMSTHDGNRTFLGIESFSITDVSFIDNKSIVYSKMVDIDGIPTYQMFTFSMKTGEEKRLHISDSNDINPVVSPDGKYVAFLSLINGCYSPYIMEFKAAIEGEDKVINKDVVLGGTLKWSPNSRYLLYVGVSYSSPAVYSIKVIDTEKSLQTKVIGSGYVASFSHDSRSVIFASYNQETGCKMQSICIGDVDGESVKEVASLSEHGCYAKSIKALEWINR